MQASTYAQAILSTISAFKQDVSVLYHEEDKKNSLSLIFTDYMVAIHNPGNPPLSAHYTFTTLPSMTKESERYNTIFLRYALAKNQDIYTLPDSALASLKMILISFYANESYVYMTPSENSGSTLSPVDFVAEVKVPSATLEHHLERSIQALVKTALPLQKQIQAIMNVSRNPMPPLSKNSYQIVKGALPIDNFDKLAQVAWKRVHEPKKDSWKMDVNFPATFKWTFFNHTVGMSGSSGACWITCKQGQWLLKTSWIWPCIGLLDNFDSTSLVQFFSAYQNTSSQIQPTGNYVLNFDPSQPMTTVLCYGIEASSTLKVNSFLELAQASRAFYLTTRV